MTNSRVAHGTHWHSIYALTIHGPNQENLWHFEPHSWVVAPRELGTDLPTCVLFIMENVSSGLEAHQALPLILSSSKSGVQFMPLAGRLPTPAAIPP